MVVSEGRGLDAGGCDTFTQVPHPSAPARCACPAAAAARGPAAAAAAAATAPVPSRARCLHTAPAATPRAAPLAVPQTSEPHSQLLSSQNHDCRRAQLLQSTLNSNANAPNMLLRWMKVLQSIRIMMLCQWSGKPAECCCISGSQVCSGQTVQDSRRRLVPPKRLRLEQVQRAPARGPGSRCAPGGAGAARAPRCPAPACSPFAHLPPARGCPPL